MTEEKRARDGLAMALFAYVLWGLFPIYWKQLSEVPAVEVLAHRVLWSMVFVAVLVVGQRRLGRVLGVLRNPRSRWAMMLSTCLIATNWGLFIWAVSDGRVTEASLGYYINPLVNVALGRLVLGEELRPRQRLSILLAAVAVGALTVAQGSLPWVSLVLAVSFGLYGLVRKKVDVGAVDGLAIETGLASPLALAYLLLLQPTFGHLTPSEPRTSLFLLGAGMATSLPLLGFAGAARRLRYTTLGMLQYLAPTLQLGCAVLLYDEPLSLERGLAFLLIWVAIAVYVSDRGPRPRIKET